MADLLQFKENDKPKAVTNNNTQQINKNKTTELTYTDLHLSDWQNSGFPIFLWYFFLMVGEADRIQDGKNEINST